MEETTPSKLILPPNTDDFRFFKRTVSSFIKTLPETFVKLILSYITLVAVAFNIIFKNAGIFKLVVFSCFSTLVVVSLFARKSSTLITFEFSSKFPFNF